MRPHTRGLFCYEPVIYEPVDAARLRPPRRPRLGIALTLALAAYVIAFLASCAHVPPPTPDEAAELSLHAAAEAFSVWFHGQVQDARALDDEDRDRRLAELGEINKRWNALEDAFDAAADVYRAGGGDLAAVQRAFDRALALLHELGIQLPRARPGAMGAPRAAPAVLTDHPARDAWPRSGGAETGLDGQRDGSGLRWCQLDAGAVVAGNVLGRPRRPELRRGGMVFV